jgi:hypothetical protein
MITNGKPKSEPNVVSSFSELAHDVVELAELQGKLFRLDAAATGRAMRSGGALLVLGIGLLLGTIPILWLTVAEALVEFAGWSRTLSLGIAGVLGLAVACTAAITGYWKLQTMFSSFQRSQEEFSRNVEWIKASLRHHPAPSRGESRSEFAANL